MIARYTLPEMGQVWSEQTKLTNWLKIEILVCEAWAQLGAIPPAALENIRNRAGFDLNRIKEIEAETRHDVIAFLTNVAEHVGEDSKYIHMGLTSSDILDTGLALQLRDSCDLILKRLHDLMEVLAARAREYKYTLMPGRTHGVHAEPVTFGLKLAGWYTEIERHIERITRTRDTVSCGKISGAVGTMANVDPAVERYVCEQLGLTPCKVSTQIIQRDRHAEYLTVLALVAGSLEKMATEIRNLQRTEIREVEEPFHSGQKGSSAMPHKRNPMISERITGLSRLIRSNALVGLENMALWHERDLTHSSTERVILPDSSILLDYILERFTRVMERLVVNRDNMSSNLEATMGLVFSQQVLLALIDKGFLREDAYRLVQEAAMDAWQRRIPFKELLQKDERIRAALPADELERLFDYSYHLKNVDYIFARCGL
ncbi:MAG: adenylosuccinate lyase [Syntrophomonadaceae bacterium]|jgi:adenylosuccinate lyase|nr:adenylosuccinate lyase [Syntrophomonadaceae bacterium]